MKPWYKSRTLWLNIILGLSFGLQDILNYSLIDDKTLLAIAIIANAFLRTITQDKITLREESNELRQS